MWGYSFQGIKIVHEQMIQEALEQRTLPRSEKHVRRSSLKHIFGAAQAHVTTTSTCQPQVILPCCDREGSYSNS
jgi:hypothetical protein